MSDSHGVTSVPPRHCGNRDAHPAHEWYANGPKSCSGGGWQLSDAEVKDVLAKSEAADPRFEKAGIPPVLYVGKEAGQWVLTAFAGEDHAAQWMKTQGGRRQMYKVTLCDIAELELVEPKPFLKVRPMPQASPTLKVSMSEKTDLATP
jgi:hypothetical protein